MADAPISSQSGARRECKPLGIVPGQRRRREDALRRQKLARTELQFHARRVVREFATVDDSHAGRDAAETPDRLQEESDRLSYQGSYTLDAGAWEEKDVDMLASCAMDRLNLDPEKSGWKPEGKEGIKSIHEWKEQQLMMPEWMVDVPHDLASNWYVLARPEGKRCLVIAANGITVSRLKNGKLLHKCPSSLPNGCRKKGFSHGSHVYCILDCIYREDVQTYYILDLMAWNGISLYDCTTEFRFFWITSKLMETEGWNEPTDDYKYRFQTLQFYNCDQNGFNCAYYSQKNFPQDGILFYNKQAHYSLGTTPLVLLWKDNKCSKYVIDTDKNGNIPMYQQVVLELGENGNLLTGDSPPLSLATVDSSFFSSVENEPKPKSLIRISLGVNAIEFVDEKLRLLNFKFEQIANPWRASADSFSKILFQHNARFNPLKFESILSIVISNEQRMEDDNENGDGVAARNY